MVTFELSNPNEYKVLINGKHIGYVRESGFFTDSTIIKQFVEIAAADLQAIAEKIIRMRSLKIDAATMLQTPPR